MTRSLFDDPEADHAPSRPLADRMRPTHLDEVLGQVAVAEGSLLRRLFADARPSSVILFGPPGSGKTTLARLLARASRLVFVELSAVMSGVKELREVVHEAERRRAEDGAGTLLFLDEIHRFHKAQQDALLPHVERGTFVLVGATTENPSFHCNPALLSRCLVVALEPLSEAALSAIARRALSDGARGLASFRLQLSEAQLGRLARTSHGDARAMLNRLEALAVAAHASGLTGQAMADADFERLLADKRIAHDRDGEQHYDLISALHKSIRGGDPQAALYWLARLFEGGEDPLFLARRLVRIASEDIGLADPTALTASIAALESFRFLGTPEGELALAQIAVHLATAPKSNTVYAALNAVRAEIKAGAVHPVPLPLRNAPTKLMKQLGFGRGYLYPHDFDEAIADQDYLPDALRGRRWYEPSPYGHEKEIARRMAWWDEVRKARKEEARDGKA